MCEKPQKCDYLKTKFGHKRYIHWLTSHRNIMKIGEHVHETSPQRSGVAIFDISIIVDFMRLNVPILATWTDI